MKSSLIDEKFVIRETKGSLRAEDWEWLNSPEGVAVIVQDYVPLDVCNRLSSNFQRSPASVNRADGVPGVKVGGDHFGKTTEQYRSEILATKAEVAALFDEAEHLPTKIRADIQRCLALGTVIRPALFQGHPAGEMRAMQWKGLGLGLHDDVAQLRHPLQHGFEIQKVSCPIACNFYSSVGIGGDLQIFNLRPDDAFRAALGLENTGYPYPKQTVDGIKCLNVAPQVGSLILLRGDWIHGVEPVISGDRVLFNFFCGAADDSTVVCWT